MTSLVKSKIPGVKMRMGAASGLIMIVTLTVVNLAQFSKSATSEEPERNRGAGVAAILRSAEIEEERSKDPEVIAARIESGFALLHPEEANAIRRLDPAIARKQDEALFMITNAPILIEEWRKDPAFLAREQDALRSIQGSSR